MRRCRCRAEAVASLGELATYRGADAAGDGVGPVLCALCIDIPLLVDELPASETKGDGHNEGRGDQRDNQGIPGVDQAAGDLIRRSGRSQSEKCQVCVTPAAEVIDAAGGAGRCPRRGWR